MKEAQLDSVEMDNLALKEAQHNFGQKSSYEQKFHSRWETKVMIQKLLGKMTEQFSDFLTSVITCLSELEREKTCP